MMPREIQKAIEISKELYEIRSRNCGNIPPYALSEEAKALRILLEVAQSHLQASELPERRIIGTEDFKCGGCGECEGCKHYRDYGHYEDIGFNACLDLCTPILAKLRGEVEEKDKRIAELERKTNFTYCAYCGKEFPLDSDSSLISEHIKTCDKHPLVNELAQLKSQLSHESKGVGVEDIENIITQALVSNTFWCEQCKGDGTIFTGNWDEFKRQIRVSCSNCDGHGFYMDKLAQAIHALLATKGVQK